MQLRLKFRDIHEGDRGILVEILTRSYQPLRDLNEFPWIPGESMWQEYDDHVFDNLGRTGECVFVTELDNRIVGFASYTHNESTATIGRNSVVPAEGGKGIGTSQVHEVIRRCAALSVRKIEVVTGIHRFFAPAQRMYVNAGFAEVSRFDDGQGVGRTLIKYEIELPAKGYS